MATLRIVTFPARAPFRWRGGSHGRLTTYAPTPAVACNCPRPWPYITVERTQQCHHCGRQILNVARAA